MQVAAALKLLKGSASRIAFRGLSPSSTLLKCFKGVRAGIPSPCIRQNVFLSTLPRCAKQGTEEILNFKNAPKLEDQDIAPFEEEKEEEESPFQMIHQEQGESVWVLGTKVVVKCSGSETGGVYSLLEYHVGPDNGAETHTHTKEEETWYLVDGCMEWTVGDRTFQAGKGCFLHLPKGVPHSFRNNSGNPAVMLVSCMPAGFESYLLEVGTPIDHHAHQKPIVVTDAHMKKAKEIGSKYGVTYE